MVYVALLCAFGSPNRTSSPVTSTPPTTRFRPAPTVGQPGEQGRESAYGVADDEDEDELREGEAELLDDLRRDRTLHVQLVVQDDRRQHRDAEVRRPGPGVRVVLELPVPQSGETVRGRAVDRCGSHLRHSFGPRCAAVA
jgi:hypothetical protein